MTFDAQCDLAAVVYGPDEDPDRLFIDFADDLSRSGCRPLGLIQVGRSCQSRDLSLGVVVLPDGGVVPLVGDRPACATGCRLDAGQLAGVATLVASVICALITRAIGADIPVLIAVPEHRFPVLVRFSEGMNVRLACRREALDRWWQSVAGQAARRPRNGALTFCEIAK